MNMKELKEFKEKSGWSYQKIANFMGVNTQSVINWIQAKAEPSAMAREKIQRFLNDYSYKEAEKP